MIVHEYDSDDALGPDRGEGFGRRFAGPIAQAVDLYRAWFAVSGVPGAAVDDVAAGCRGALAHWAPELVEESDAIALGAGLSADEVFTLTCRTEIVAAAVPSLDGARPTECSTLVAAAPARPLSFQTWDWVPDLAPVGVMWRYRPAPGQAVTAFVEPGMVGKLGLNDGGLSVHLNFLSHGSDAGAEPGVPVHAVQRAVLDRAATVDEAIAIALSAPVSASAALTVVAGAEAASIELCPAGSAVVRPDSQGWLAHTNHFLDPRLSVDDLATPRETTWGRYAWLEDARARRPQGGLATVAEAIVGASGTKAAVCLHGNPDLPSHRRSRTLLSILFDASRGRVEYWPGHPADAATHGPRIVGQAVGS